MSWRKDARGVVRRYPSHKSELEAIRSGSVTPNYSGMPGGHSASRTTEDVALRTLPRDAQTEYDAVDFAIRTTVANYPRDHKDRLEVIRLLYWVPDKLTIEGAAMRIPCSVQTAKGWNSSFLALVDAYGMIMAARF